MRTEIIVKHLRLKVNVFGPTIEFLFAGDEDRDCILLGTIPPGVSVPLHSHPDFENFYVLRGVVQVWREDRIGRWKWDDAKAGDSVHIAGGVAHAFRNISSEPVVQIISTTPQLGKFFQEVGRRERDGENGGPPTIHEVERFLHMAKVQGHWIATPDENAAIGIPKAA